MPTWIDACDVEDIEPEDVLRFDHGGASYALYRDPKGAFFATDGLCTHEHVHLADGLVMGDQIECPKHNATFDYRTGEALRLPACENLKTYPAEVIDGEVRVALG